MELKHGPVHEYEAPAKVLANSFSVSFWQIVELEVAVTTGAGLTSVTGPAGGVTQGPFVAVMELYVPEARPLRTMEPPAVDTKVADG